MKRSERVASEFNSVLRLLGLAAGEMLQIRELEDSTRGDLEKLFDSLSYEVEDAMMETCMPLEMEENDRDEEIRRLERRIMELRAQ